MKGPKVETVTKNFVFEDCGGSAVRGKIRIETRKENRKNEEALLEVVGKYDFD